MNMSAIKTVATQTVGRSGLVIRKFSPQILTGVGIVGVVAAGVFASKATLNLEPTVEKLQADLLLVKDLQVEAQTDRNSSYTDKTALRDKTVAYRDGAISIIKLYGPSVTLGALSISCIIAGQGIMQKRNLALVAAYKGLESSYNKYRARVVEELGEQLDKDFFEGVVRTTEKVDGKNVEVVKPHETLGDVSIYARFFDETNDEWDATPEYNLSLLVSKQNWANDVLKARGHLFLNEVYKELGFPHTPAGAVVGWVYGAPGKDSFVDFGLYDPSSEEARAFINGFNPAIRLDFNVDGVIWDLI